MAATHIPINWWILLLMLAAAALIYSGNAKSKESDALPDYIVKKFGKPPVIQIGPLSEELQEAVDTAFIKSTTKSTWGREQTQALSQIAE